MLDISIVIPCLNESETIGSCIEKAKNSLRELNLKGEIIVADNGSVDDSRDIAQSLMARTVSVEEKGYGSALQGGIEAARGKWIVMGDADDSYDFGNIKPFVEKLEEGYDLVNGLPTPERWWKDHERGDALETPLDRQPGPLEHREAIF